MKEIKSIIAKKLSENIEQLSWREIMEILNILQSLIWVILHYLVLSLVKF